MCPPDDTPVVDGRTRESQIDYTRTIPGKFLSILTKPPKRAPIDSPERAPTTTGRGDSTLPE